MNHIHSFLSLVTGNAMTDYGGIVVVKRNGNMGSVFPLTDDVMFGRYVPSIAVQDVQFVFFLILLTKTRNATYTKAQQIFPFC